MQNLVLCGHRVHELCGSIMSCSQPKCQMVWHRLIHSNKAFPEGTIVWILLGQLLQSNSRVITSDGLILITLQMVGVEALTVIIRQHSNNWWYMCSLIGKHFLLQTVDESLIRVAQQMVGSRMDETGHR